ncbi:hypothetical protein [Streptomyces sp. NPDC052727]|uniref:hypothetical protein n=1 Tax=unclassified Streptomyces TaxID=2593676 RepID=UPI003431118E
MGVGSRFHLDQDGHSVTVQPARASGPVEVLVDGKVVGRGTVPKAGTTVLRAEFPGDPPRPLIIRLGEMGGVVLCEMEVDRARYLMPRVPLLPERPPPWQPPPHPFLHVAKSLRRAVLRAVRRCPFRGH